MSLENKFQHITYFKGLNSLRFFAAFLVLIHHAESLRSAHNLPNLAWFGLFQNGQNAVSFFFVLSGFLITYLLLKEAAVHKDISVKRFYIKRIFRIWPLYFFLIIIGVVIQPYFIEWFNIPYEMPYSLANSWYYFVFFVPGLVTFYFGRNLLEPLWSIGVEEVFYLIWAPMFKWLRKFILQLLLGIVLIKFILLIFSSLGYFSELWKFLIRIHQFDAMAIGGIGAYFIYTQGERLTKSFLYHRISQEIIYFTLLLFLYVGEQFWDPYFDRYVGLHLLKYMLFLYLIIGVSLVENNIIKVENKVLSYLGKISYGIYMYHLLILTLLIPIFQGFINEISIFRSTIIYYASAIILTIAVAALSNSTFERYFERKKIKLLSH